MLIKAGVDISRLNKQIRLTLKTVASIYESLDKTELVVTSTYEGTHHSSSLHYCNDAYDVRLPLSDTHKILRAIAGALGPDYDVLLELTHMHIEYDKKP